MHSKYDNMYKNVIFSFLIYINHPIITCINYMLSQTCQKSINKTTIIHNKLDYLLIDLGKQEKDGYALGVLFLHHIYLMSKVDMSFCLGEGRIMALFGYALLYHDRVNDILLLNYWVGLKGLSIFWNVLADGNYVAYKLIILLSFVYIH